MRQLILLIVILFCCATPALGTTYYVAQSSSGAGNGTTYADRMSVAAHNARTFAAGDVIYLVDTITSRIIVPSNGSAGNPIIYRGDYPGHIANITPSGSMSGGGAVSLAGRSYITLYNQTTRAVIDGGITSGTVDDTSYDNHDLVGITDASHIVIDNWEIKRGWNAIRSAACSDISVTRSKISLNRIRGIALNGGISNITIGGAPGAGNEFDRNAFKLVWGLNRMGADLYFYQGNNIVISHNHIHGTPGEEKDGWGLIGIAVYGANSVMIEFNTINDLGAKNFRGAIHLKGLSSSHTNHKIVIRNNHIYNMPVDDANDGAWVYVSGAAIVCTRDTYDLRIYHNRIHRARAGISMDINGEAGVSDGANGIHITDVYIWGNVLSDIRGRAFSFQDGYSGNTDDYDEVYVVNNSVANSLTYTAPGAPIFSSQFNYGPGDDGTDDTGTPPHIHAHNNILAYSMNGQAERYVLYSRETADGNWLAYDRNLHYDPADPGNVRINYGGTLYDIGSASLPASWNTSDPAPANPLYVDPQQDLRLTEHSPAIGAGMNLGAVIIPDIIFPHYSATALSFAFDQILSPVTDWDTIPPAVVTVDQNTPANWMIGAYAYATPGEDTTPPTIEMMRIDTDGIQLIVNLSEFCIGNTGFSLSPSGGAATLTYFGGTGADRIYSVSRPIQHDEVITGSYTPGDIADGSANPLVQVSDIEVYNGSTAGMSASTVGLVRNKAPSPIVNEVPHAMVHGLVSYVPVPPAASCNPTPYSYVGISGTLAESLGDSYLRKYWGDIINPDQITKTICQKSFVLSRAAGDISGKTYRAYVYTLGASNELATLKATSTNSFTGDNGWSFHELVFVFAPTVLASGDAVVVAADSGGDSANYAKVHYRNADLNEGYSSYARWRNTGELGTIGHGADFSGGFYEWGEW